MQTCNFQLQKGLFRKPADFSENAAERINSRHKPPLASLSDITGTDTAGRHNEDKKKDTFIQDILYCLIYPPDTDVRSIKPDILPIYRTVILT